MAKSGLNAAVSNAVKSNFDLEKFKKVKNINSTSFKKQEWIPVSDAVQEVLSIPGIPHGHITLLRGHSDTGKSTLFVDIAKNCQKKQILPVFIITEMKFNWQHVIDLGFEATKVVDDEGNDSYSGFFIYVDRSTLDTIEDVSAFIMGLLDDQKKGNLPYDLCFLWDSVGSINCELGVRSNKSNNEWSAGAMSKEFGNMVNQQIVMSRKSNMPYTNSLVCVNKIWVQKADSPMGKPKMQNKGGTTMWFDASMIVTLGNIANAGTSKLKAVKNKKNIDFAKITNIQVDKWHIGDDITTKGNIVMTKHGFILNEPKSIERYKKDYSKDWLSALGASSDDDIDIVEEQDDVVSDEEYEENDITMASVLAKLK